MSNADTLYGVLLPLLVCGLLAYLLHLLTRDEDDLLDCSVHDPSSPWRDHQNGN